MFEVFCHMPAKKNVSGVAAIHDALRDVNAGAGDVRLLVQVGDLVDRSAVNAHSHFEFGMFFQLVGDFHGAQHRRFGCSAKDQRAAVARRQAQQLAFCFG
jgi:hypothetical protein